MLRMDIIEEGRELARLVRSGANLHRSEEATTALKKIERYYRKHKKGQICEKCKQRAWAGPRIALCDKCTEQEYGQISVEMFAFSGFSMMHLVEVSR